MCGITTLANVQPGDEFILRVEQPPQAVPPLYAREPLAPSAEGRIQVPEGLVLAVCDGLIHLLPADIEVFA